MQEIATISREEIKAVLIEVHRRNQILWCKWLKQTTVVRQK